MPPKLNAPAGRHQPASPTISGPLLTFEGVSNMKQFQYLWWTSQSDGSECSCGEEPHRGDGQPRVAVYDKATGNRIGPVHAIGDLWANFAVPSADDTSGDPVVLYDRYADRWLLSHFHTDG